MKTNIPKLFLINGRVNIISTLIFWGVFAFHQTYQNRDTTKLFLTGYFILTMIIIIYAINYWLGVKLVNQYLDATYSTEPKKLTRIIFYVLEIILFFLYTYLIYTITASLKISNFSPLNFTNGYKLIALIAFYAGYFSSLFRLLFTWYFFKMVKNQNTYLLDNLGEILHEEITP